MYNIHCSIYENLHPKVVNVYTTKRSGGKTPLILNLGIRVNDQLHVPAGLPSGNEPHVTRDWVGPWGGMDAVWKRTICCPCPESNHDSSDVQSVTWSLYRLRYWQQTSTGHTEVLHSIWNLLHNSLTRCVSGMLHAKVSNFKIIQ